MHIDIPSEQILPELETSIRKQMEEVMLPEKKKVIIDKIEWTEKGLRVWIQTKT